MPERSSNSTNGSGDYRTAPQSGQFGYVQRPTSYYSASRTTSSLPATTDPTISEASAAAKRSILAEHTNQPARHAPTTSSFDFLPMNQETERPKPTEIIAEQPVLKFASHQPMDTATSRNPQNFDSGNSQQVSTLPNDLASFITERPFAQPPAQKGIRLKLPQITLPRAVASLGICLLLIGAPFVVNKWRSHQNDSENVKGAATGSSGQDKEGGLAPDASPHEGGNAPSVQYYRTANSYPRVIRISKTKTEARVLPLSISPTGALKAPANIFDVGWYKDSAKPGEEGAVILNGHASGATKDGVFAELGAIKTGDSIEIERGDGEVFHYIVKEVRVYEADQLDMSSVMVPYTPGKQGLNLITSGGKFNTNTNKYEPRTVVYAIL